MTANPQQMEQQTEGQHHHKEDSKEVLITKGNKTNIQILITDNNLMYHHQMYLHKIKLFIAKDQLSSEEQMSQEMAN